MRTLDKPLLLLVCAFILEIYSWRVACAQSVAASTTPAQENLPPDLLLTLADFLIKPLSERTILVQLPLVDTSPNRGISSGILPVWVVQTPDLKRIETIHAPSLTYNSIFGLTATYRYYHYPTPRNKIEFLTSISQKFNRSASWEFDGPIASRETDLDASLSYDRDASMRFFGFGPNSPQADDSNYTLESFTYHLDLDTPFTPGSPWKIRLGHDLFAGHVTPRGPLSTSDLETVFPDLIPLLAPGRRDYMFLYRLGVRLDTRDNPITTTQGTYWRTYYQISPGSLGSDFNFGKFGTDFRWFKPQTRHWTHAVQILLDQANGDIPFYLQPFLGGKDVFRAYGEGRYTDKGRATFSLEERLKLWEAPLAGVTAEISLDPFYQAGLVFPRIQQMQTKYTRQVIGAAIRMIARPQVVGSVDFGVGSEGLAAFLDINYSY